MDELDLNELLLKKVNKTVEVNQQAETSAAVNLPGVTFMRLCGSYDM